ncbi:MULTISPECIES: hypothetical protein [unclassified Modestobacter]|uniref:hypothetical protein n=1 Tax=unclassified Modestobacter TaxID=2643866 RepID=UPI0022AAD3D5|nr:MULTISPECIES: hypothetical protein [unclassified Modestobacter]MCZ2811200.1 hypothetical protein [Modestobacter sp. VKM Ac-2979]MCZ2840713.1 hypothetical protein [Modestobacter sp. VKM Ac-2980]MCZ2848003.1 hypothetical protein [Modestobacter sp. VKM Ac-2978]
MTRRTLHTRRAMIAGLAVSVFLTVMTTLQAPPGSRLASFVLTAAACAVLVTSVLLTARAVQGRQGR